MDISVVGLGHLGLPLAVLLAASGHHVRGVDTDADHVARLRRGDVAWHEPDLTETLRASAGSFAVTTDARAAARASGFSIIAVPTPTAPDGAYDAAHVVAAAATIGTALRGQDRPHVVAVLSTVMPGTLDGAVRQALAGGAGRDLGEGLGLCYTPAFGALGSLLRDYRAPDFLLIGQSDPAAGDFAADILGSIHTQATPILRRALIDAELAKIALNNFVLTKIAFANAMGVLCGGIAGADVDQVLTVLGQDRRIGSRFLRAAMPYGGPCFARDAGAMAALARRQNTAMPLADAATLINDGHRDAIVAAIAAATPPGGRVAILGLAFRHATDVTTASPNVEIAERLAAEGFEVTAWDPLARLKLGSGITLAPTLADAVAGSYAVLIGNDDPLCATLPDCTRPDGGPVVVFDYWRRLPAARSSQFDVRRLG